MQAETVRPACRPRGRGRVLWRSSCFVYVLNFLDRQLLSILAKPIQDDLGVTDGQLGLISGLYFALFYCLLAIPVGLARGPDQPRARAVVRLRAVERGDRRLRLGVQLPAAGDRADVGGRGRGRRRAAVVRDHLRLLSRRASAARRSASSTSGRRSGRRWASRSVRRSPPPTSWRAAFISLGAGGHRHGADRAGCSCASRCAAGSMRRARGARMPCSRAQAPFWPTCRMFFSHPVLLRVSLATGATQFVTYAIAQLHHAVPDAREGHDAAARWRCTTRCSSASRSAPACTPPGG